MAKIDLTDLQAQRLNDVRGAVGCLIDGLHRKAREADEAERETVELSTAEMFHVLDMMSFVSSLPTPQANEEPIGDGVQQGIELLERLPKDNRQATEDYITGVLTVFWGALWGTFGAEYARGFIEGQLRGMERGVPSETYTEPQKH